ncbi:MAG: bifunctional 4-hydroxy-2-oxoglutarate aldolase/2-dehydro-3-deoxy-phosphogluconate aldolase [Acidobacteria bacterium]|nr:bifunctional 4-hydroxy-2-oxoglutarate aldolase/2-dehydro-3-deoxy-phosphogluconate aldolase [Acidobacteriota bacterium]
MNASNAALEPILRACPIIPVITLPSAECVMPLAETLITNGLTTLEITLRSPFALEAIGHLRRSFPKAVIGAGTLTQIDQITALESVGAQFVVSPGATDALIAAMNQSKMAFLPGAATPSEMMRLAQAGYTVQKFFPAAAMGGPAALKALSGPFSDLRFCATGGIGFAQVADYLRLQNVCAIGGSWMVDPALIQEGAWSEIGQRAYAAGQLAITLSNGRK